MRRGRNYMFWKGWTKYVRQTALITALQVINNIKTMITIKNSLKFLNKKAISLTPFPLYQTHTPHGGRGVNCKILICTSSFLRIDRAIKKMCAWPEGCTVCQLILIDTGKCTPCRSFKSARTSESKKYTAWHEWHLCIKKTVLQLRGRK